METTFQADRTQAAWRDFAIGLFLFLVALRVFQSRLVLAPPGSIATQALMVAVIVSAHAALYRFGRFTEVTGTVASLGRVGVLRASVAGVAVLALMFGVWRIAQTIGGPIERPLPWGPALFDRSVVPARQLLAISFYVVVTGPIVEELCFRGWMQRGLGLRFTPAVSIVTPAILFAALHASVYSHPAYLLIPLGLGLTLGLVAERSRSLWPAVILHALWNVTMVAVAARAAEQPLSWRAPRDPLGVALVLAEIALSGLVLLRALWPPDQSADRADSKPVLDAQKAA